MPIKKRYLIPLLLLTGFLIGPRESFPALDPEMPKLDLELTQLDSFLQARESQIANLRPDNQARIIWADSVRKTPYSVVYLHGFSAGPMEADPIHFEFAKRYGCNLFLARLAEHGINDKESFGDLTPQDLLDSAKEALAIGQMLGERVIVMSCSTGSTLSIYLAAHHPELTDAMIMYSPNIQLDNPLTALLTAPWGLQIARLTEGKYRDLPIQNPEAGKYWTTHYRTEGIIVVKALCDMTMKKAVFEQLHQPFFAGYWYKNEEESDHVISIDAIQDFYNNAATPDTQKRKVAFTEVGSHVITSRLQSKDLDAVREATFQYAEEVLGLRPVIN